MDMKGMVFPGLAPSTYEDVELFIKTSPYAKRRFDEASSVLGYSLADAFSEANEYDHEVMECAFLANTVACLDYFKDQHNCIPEVAIGASFGGMATIVHTESLTYAETVWLSKLSANLSKKWFDRLGNYQTHFIYNLPLEEANNLVNKYNSKGLYLELVGYLDKVVSLCGEAATIKLLKDELNDKSKCFSLHTMMQPIHSKILTPMKLDAEREIYNQMVFKDPKFPIISDVNGDVLRSKEEFIQTLLDGYDHPIRWDCVSDRMNEFGMKEVYVVGPKNLFSQLLKSKFTTITINPNTVTDRMTSAVNS